MMKKTIAILFLVAATVACKSTSVVSTKLDNKTEKLLKGNWTITGVTFPGSEVFSVNAFQLGDSKCFIGSNWNFVSNNNKGQMTLQPANANCKDFSSPITWYINKEGNFVLKIINDYKAKNVNRGYVLNVQNISATNFELVDQITVGGQLQNITYTFQKND